MFKISCIQLKSSDNIKDNLDKSINLILKAIKSGSDLIITPEASSIMSLDKIDLLDKVTLMSKDLYCCEIKKIAKKYKKWILIGSLITKNFKNKIVNRSILINTSGKIVKYYDKIHMYDVTLSSKEKYQESKVFNAGNKIKTYNLPWGKLGFTICYDLRFPNMFRKLSKAGCLFISVPSAFTLTTGKKHWHSLLRARAIENFCYIFAPAQGGTHSNGRKTYGHSLVVSPDGKIMKELKSNKEGYITVNIDPKIPKKLRQIIPSLRVD
mgnify:FL=1|tara:strand:- start:276 stop:1076 length:801 start_codon:yes stop_codon:yes gene_type:complete